MAQKQLTLELAEPVCAGETRIASGTFEVAVDEQNGKVRLSGAGLEVLLSATLRSSKVRVNTPVLHLLPVEREPRWLLIVRMPPAHEWVVNLEKCQASQDTSK
jgi:hypothetical protein